MAGTETNSAPNGAGDTLASAHAAMRADHNLQFQFEQSPPPPQPPPWAQAFADLMRAIGPFLQYVFWAGLAAIVILIVFLLLREIAGRWPMFARRVKADKPEAAVPKFKPTAARAQALLEEADRLAREGRFSEAARVLLHRSIEDIERAYPIAIGPALTSREIAQLEPLSSQGRDVFTRIALAVERSLFGERPLDAAGFAACREAYSSFAFGAHG